MNRTSGLVLFSLAYLVILEVLLVGAILYWPSFAGNVPALRSLTKPIQMFGEMVEQIEDKGLVAYILIQHFFKACNTLGTAAAVLFAAPAVAGEAHRGTLELWLARPLSRTRLLMERYAAGALAVILPVFLTTLSIPYLAERVDELEPYAPYLLCAVHQSIFLLVIYSLTFLCSSLGSHPTKIALAILFATTFEFAIYMIKVWTHWSIFRLSDLQTMIAIADDRRLDWGLEAALLGASALFLAASLLVFRRRTP